MRPRLLAVTGRVEVSPPPRHVVVLADGVEMAFRLIPAGTFRMGARGRYQEEEPVHRVAIPQAFWLGETPVTQAQLEVWTRLARVEHANQYAGRPDSPAERVTWFQAVAFCSWLTKRYRARLPRGRWSACLPTEAEWEYACRAGTDTEYSTGDGEAALGEAGWFSRNSGKSTRPVGVKRPNAFELYDMHGNVMEWCHDVWDDSAYRQRVDGDSDPGWDARRLEYARGRVGDSRDDRNRVQRGGSWAYVARGCRSAFRDGDGPDVRYRNVGFRVCLIRSPAARRGRARAGREARGAGAPRDEAAEATGAERRSRVRTPRS